jgi:hypothetical protein
MIPDKMTPRQFAYQQIVNNLHDMYGTIERTHSYNGVDLSPGETRETLRHIANLHDDLADKAKLDHSGLSTVMSREPVLA